MAARSTMPFSLHWRACRIRFPHGVTRCPGLTRMTQELELLSAWLCADIWEGVSFRARILELFEGETLMLFTILVPGGWGIILSRLALESTWLPLFERKYFQFSKELSFLFEKKISVNVKGKYILVSFHVNRPVVQLREFLYVTRVFSAVSAFPNCIISSALTVGYLSWRNFFHSEAVWAALAIRDSSLWSSPEGHVVSHPWVSLLETNLFLPCECCL